MLFPIVAPFDGNSVRSEVRLPANEFVFADGECHMQRAISAMAGNGPAGQGNGLPRGAHEFEQAYCMHSLVRRW